MDPLDFKDTKKYRDRVRAAAQKGGTGEAVVTGVGRIGDQPAVLCAFEFGFLGGSMGSVVGEKLARAIELASVRQLPVVIVSASGGARMQEGILSLMQMAKTSAALHRLAEGPLPLITVVPAPPPPPPPRPPRGGGVRRGGRGAPRPARRRPRGDAPRPRADPDAAGRA